MKSPKEIKGKAQKPVETFYKDKTESSEDILDDINEYDDVIPASPSPPSKKNNSSSKSRLTSKEIIMKLPKTDIVELIDIIDGNSIDRKDHSREDTFLSHLDKYSKKVKKDVTDNNLPCSSNNGEIDKMDVDLPNENQKDSSVEGSKVPMKRKISDYFQIKNKSS